MVQENRTGATVRAARGWLKIALVVSLGVNILIAGLVGGALWRGAAPERIRVERDVSVLGLRAFYRALGKQDRAALLAEIKANRGQYHAGRKLFRAYLEAVSKAVLAEPFDAARLNRVLARQARAVSDNFAYGQRVLVAHISAMSPQDRRAFAKALRTSRRASPRPNP